MVRDSKHSSLLAVRYLRLGFVGGEVRVDRLLLEYQAMVDSCFGLDSVRVDGGKEYAVGFSLDWVVYVWSV